MPGSVDNKSARKRRNRKKSVSEETKRLLLQDVSDSEEEHAAGSDEDSISLADDYGAILRSEMGDVLKRGGDELAAFAQNAASQAEHVVRKMIDVGWSVRPFHHLPEWLQDNDYILFGHRPPLPSFDACFKSIFRLHTETGNIWTHLLGCIVFIGIGTYFHLWPHIDIQLQERIVFGVYFLGAIVCLGFSTLFHTVNCHSKSIGNLFLKLDYCGIVLLIVGSYIPWLYFVFYCHFKPKVVYSTMMTILGLSSIAVSLWDKFSEHSWKPWRAGVFTTFAIFGVIPTVHFGLIEGWFNTVFQKSLYWLILSSVLYITGTVFYAMRVPERFFPGKFDIWLHSHQIFHIFVIGGAIMHYFGISEVAIHRLTFQECDTVFV